MLVGVYVGDSCIADSSHHDTTDETICFRLSAVRHCDVGDVHVRENVTLFEHRADSDFPRD